MASTCREHAARDAHTAARGGVWRRGLAAAAAAERRTARVATPPPPPSRAPSCRRHLDRMDLCEASAAPRRQTVSALWPAPGHAAVGARAAGRAGACASRSCRANSPLVAANDDLWCAAWRADTSPCVGPAGVPGAGVRGRAWRAVYAAGAAGRGAWPAAPATQESCWIVIDGAIYDVTTFVPPPGWPRRCSSLAAPTRRPPSRSCRTQVAHRYVRTLTVPGLELPAEDFPPRFATADASPGAGWRATSEIAAGLRASAPMMSARLNLLNEVVPPQLRTLRELMPARVGVGAISRVGRAALRVGGAATAAKECLSAFHDPLDLRATLSERISGERTRVADDSVTLRRRLVGGECDARQEGGGRQRGAAPAGARAIHHNAMSMSMCCCFP